MAGGMGIQGLGIGGAMPSPIKPPTVEAEGVSFKDALFNRIEQVNTLQQQAEAAVADLAAGRARNVDEVMAAVQKADLAFQTLLQIRSKLLEAYEEISQMRI